MFGSKTKIKHIHFKYDTGICILKYMNNNSNYAIDICLWDANSGPRQVTINNFYAKNFFNQMKLEQNHNLRSLESLIKKYLI